MPAVAQLFLLATVNKFNAISVVQLRLTEYTRLFKQSQRFPRGNGQRHFATSSECSLYPQAQAVVLLNGV